jgi:hypothetical protein
VFVSGRDADNPPATKKKNNKKKKSAKGKSNGDAVKGQDTEENLTLENGDGEGEVEDSEQSAVVRLTPVHLATRRRQGAGSDYISRTR